MNTIRGDIKMVAVNSLMTYSRVYVGVIMSAADELFLVLVQLAADFQWASYNNFFTGFVLGLLCAVFKRKFQSLTGYA